MHTSAERDDKTFELWSRGGGWRKLGGAGKARGVEKCKVTGGRRVRARAVKFNLHP